MKIVVTESGGYAGLTQEVAVDTTTLDDATAQRVERAVHDARFFDLPSVVGSVQGFDLPKQGITVTDGGREHSVSYVTFDESPEAVAIRQLVETVRALA